MQPLIVLYELGEDGKSIKCLRCGMTSHHPTDVEQRYCANCHVFLDDIWPPARAWWLLNVTPIPEYFMNEADLEKHYPSIPWREPLPTKCADGTSGLACRFCIAMEGLRGHEIKDLPQTEAEFEKHMKAKHGLEAAGKSP